MNETSFSDIISEVIDCLTKDDNLVKCVSALEKASKASPFKEIETHDYLRFLNCLLDGLKTEWYRTISNDQQQLYESFFFNWCNQEAMIMLLFKMISEARPSLKLETSLGLLGKFISSNNFVDLIIKQCALELDSLKQDLRCDVWQYLVSSIISLPDKLAPIINVIPSHITELFSSKNYFQTITDAIIKSMTSLHLRIQNSMDVNLEFLRRLLGRCCLAGFTEIVMKSLLQFFVHKTENDYIWRRLSQQLFVGVSDQYLEVILTFILRNCKSYEEVKRLIGDAVSKDPRVNRLLTHKLLLVRCFQNDIILNNLLGYLSKEKTQNLLVEVFFRIIEAWGNKTSFKYRPYHNHLYLTKALIISLRYMTDVQKEENKAVILQKMMKSMDAHLSSPMKPLHQIGMVTAKLICEVVDPTGPQLEFKLENDEVTIELQSLLNFNYETNTVPEGDNLNEELEKNPQPKIPENEITQESSNLDSDDDLEPYDMSNDEVKVKYSKPRYLKDCIEGLLVQNDPEHIQASLESVEGLIRKDSVGLSELAVELTKILLCMENVCGIDNFTSLRFGAMTALAVKCPRQVSTYFCEQFYLRNYNIRQRMDILEVLAAAAQEMARPKQTERLITVVKPHDQYSKEGEDWKSIVQKRIESKTRYFHKTHVRKEIIGSSNTFGQVAGYFFFPLMRSYDNPENTFDLLGSDFFLLGRLVWCLGTILHAAKNCSIILQMGQALLEFVSTIKYHTESYVRRAVIFAMCEVIANLPASYLTSSLQEMIIESSEWLKDVIERDTDSECQHLAVKTLMLLDFAMKEELKSEIKESSYVT